MTEDELELSILEKYVALHESAKAAVLPAADKCARELDMRAVLREITGKREADLDQTANLWINRLAPLSVRFKGPLKRCSNTNLRTSAHKYHARAYMDPVNNAPAPAWDRIRELREKMSVQPAVAPARELEQKFQILFSHPQEQKDFDKWRAGAGDPGFTIGALFIDIDHFKDFNNRLTETTVDQTILPQAQELLRELTAHRGGAYRHGGEEFVVLLPNHNLEEVKLFAEKLRSAFELHRFQVADGEEALTVSIGVALWPDHGANLSEVLDAANQAEHRAKGEGRNTVREAT